MSEIDARADVSPSSRIGSGVKIGAFAVVGVEVELGDGCVLDHHAVVQGPARLGRGNHVYPFSVIGGDPQDLTYKGERVSLEIGDANEFHEFSTVNRGTVKGGGITRIGSHNLIMSYAHIGHDCVGGRSHHICKRRDPRRSCDRGGLRHSGRVLSGAAILPHRKAFLHRRAYGDHAGCSAIFESRFTAR